MKVIVFAQNKISNYVDNPFVEITKKTFGDECLIWDGTRQKDLDYFIANKDPRIYEGVLNYCEDSDVEFLYITVLYYPEHLLIELNARKKKGNLPKTKIVFANDWRTFLISDARINAVADLLKYDCIHKMVIFSNLGPEAKYPKTFCAEDFNDSPKIKLLYTMKSVDIKKTSKEISRIKYGIPQDKFVFLFFGSMHFGKGIDILLNAMKDFDEDVVLFISSGTEKLNFDMDMKNLKRKNIIWKKECAKNEELSDIFATCDSVVMPYRKTYNNGGSGVLVQSCQAHKPVIMPKITPFKETVEKYSLGILFEAENVNDLKFAMQLMVEDHPRFDKKAKFDQYINEIQSWNEYVKTLFE